LPALLTSRRVSPNRPTPELIPLSASNNVWTDQKILNIVMVLEVIRLLCVRDAPGTALNQVSHLFDVLL